MKFRNKATFFHVWEDQLWGDRVDANDNFSSLTVWITTIVTAIAVCSKFFSTFDFNPELLGEGAKIGLGTAILCWTFNFAESIIACKDVSVILKRSLLLLFVLLGGVIIGTLLSIVVIAIVCIVFAIIVFYFVVGLITGSLKGSPTKGKWITEDGRIINGEKELGSNIVHGDDGDDYKEKDPWGM